MGLFGISKNFKSEYSLSVVKIGQLLPIDGSDFLAQTFIGDASIVVRKDLVKEGDVMFYAPNESQLCEAFLSVNNLFDIGCYEKNANSTDVEYCLKKAEYYSKEVDEVEDEHQVQFLLREAEKFKNEAKSKCGFFTSNGRIRMIRLRKVPSMGFLFSKEQMAKYCKSVNEVNLEEWVNKEFDIVNGEQFIKVYVPPMKVRPIRGDKSVKRNKRIERFDRMVDGEFSFHYDTSQLSKNMYLFSPSDQVVISNKLHGTSGIFSKVKVKTPLKLPFYKKWFNKFVDTFNVFTSYRVTDHVVEYGNVYSSRGVIKNQYINTKVTGGYYNSDIWGEVNEVIKPYITDGMTVYGEICGYVGDKPIQKGYDYGCNQGEWFFMPYRITTKHDGGKSVEWEVDEVKKWTENLIVCFPELGDKIRPIQIFYQGTLQDLYPNIPTEHHWQENVLQAMMADKEHFGMEELEPLCKQKSYREGICIRKCNSLVAECFKLKCKNFLFQEGKAISNGEVDIEMQEGYGEDTSES